jgi:hypothetical protein
MTTTASRTVIFWGAGATATLGMRTTEDQGAFLGHLAGGRGESLNHRVKAALHGSSDEQWTSALCDLLTILGDQVEGSASAIRITPAQIDAMRRNWRPGADDEELRGRIVLLRTLYDWPALKAAINICPAVKVGITSVTDLFNILEMHGHSGHGFRKNEDEFLTPQQVIGARNALKMLLQTMFYIDYHQQSLGKSKQALDYHYEFGVALAKRMQRQGLALAESMAFDDRRFYMGDVSFACLNYDPIALWSQIIANSNLNHSTAVPHVGCPASRLQIFHDLGHFVAGRRIVERGEESGRNTPWHPMNESSAQRLNDADHGANVRIRISKFLFPHGCLCWRECPDCGKLSSYLGDAWDLDSATLIPPPPLMAFVQHINFRARRKAESDAWEKGEVDARACVHCDTLTYAHHTQTLMQSNFKSAPPPAIEEIQRDLRVTVQNADHIVLMGYSLPPDDVTYRAFFAARCRRDSDPAKPKVKCSVVVGRGHPPHWLGPSDWPSPHSTLEAACDLFGKDNVRFYGGGIPNVFLNGGGAVTESSLEHLLTWERAL